MTDGGPAYPQHDAKDLACENAFGDLRGMSLRDYFAIHANQPGRVEIAEMAGWRCRDFTKDSTDPWWEDCWYTLSAEDKAALWAKVRYMMADAMLRERERDN